MYYDKKDCELKNFAFSYSNYTLTLHFEDKTESFKINHKGNVLEITSSDSSDVFMMREYETALAGKYQLSSSSNDDISKMNITLGYSGALEIEYDDGESTILDTDDAWYIDRAEGYIGMYYNDDSDDYQLVYYYFLTLDGLYLIETDFSHTHFLEKIA
jgi:hypothetical protein